MKNILLIISLLCLLFGCTGTPYEPEWVDAIFIMDDDGSNVTYLIDDCPKNVQFTPDDSKIIINRGQGGIYLINLNGTENDTLTDSLIIHIVLPSISPDGIKIVFAACLKRGVTTDIYIMNIDGTDLMNLTNSDEIAESYPSFSSDGTKIVYITNSDEKSTISTMNENGNNKDDIIIDTVMYVYSYPIFDIEGKKIYYIFRGEQKGLYSINIDDSTTNTLLFEGYLEPYPISMSEDGSKIVFSASSHIYIINNDGSGIMDLGYGKSPMISNECKKIVFNGVTIMNIDSSERKGLEYGSKPRFSFDDSKIVYIGQRKINNGKNSGILF